MSYPTVTVALTGASGLQYGFRLIDCLLQADRTVSVVYSPAAQTVGEEEMGITLPLDSAQAETFFVQHFAAKPHQITVYGHKQWAAPIASGSNPNSAMVICPCSMGTLAALSHGLSDNLIERAADVCLKERRPLILVPRETPLSVIHLENMLKLARLGVVILPPTPGFYTRPASIEDIVDFVVARILDQLQVPHQLIARWKAKPV